MSSGTNGGPASPDPPPTAQQFQGFVRRLLAVPKKDVDKQIDKEKAKKKRRR